MSGQDKFFFCGFLCIVQGIIKGFVLFGCLRCVWISNSGLRVFWSI